MKLKDVLLIEGDVTVPGIGTISSEMLTAQIQGQLQDLLVRAQEGNFRSITKTQFDNLALYWDAASKSSGGGF